MRDKSIKPKNVMPDDQGSVDSFLSNERKAEEEINSKKKSIISKIENKT